MLVKTLMHGVDYIVSDERDKVEEKSHIKQVLNMNGYLDWLINSIPTIQPFLESTTSVSSDNTSDHCQETEIDTTTGTPSNKKSPVVLPYIKGVWGEIGECLNNMTSRLISSL